MRIPLVVGEGSESFKAVPGRLGSPLPGIFAASRSDGILSSVPLREQAAIHKMH
jgi:hypothetical protein